MEWLSTKKEEKKEENKGKWVEVCGKELWLPDQEEEEVIGAIIQILETKYGKEYIIETAPNERIVTPAHTILQERLSNFKEGDVVKIIYRGEVPSNKGSPLKLYKVFKYVQEL